MKVADQLRKAEKKIKLAAEEAYLDPAKGLEAKERGNEKFKAGDFPAAITEYTEAVKRDPTNAVYYNNRAAAYMKLGKTMVPLSTAQSLRFEYIYMHICGVY